MPKNKKITAVKEDAVRSVDRAFAILNCFTLDTPRLSQTAIAEEVGLPVTTALRIVGTLTQLGMLKKHSDRSYSLGNGIYLLGAVAHAHFRPQHAAQLYMQQLRDDTKEAVSLYGIENECRVCFAHIPSLLTMRCVVRVGDRFPLWAGAGGKSLLAYADQKIIEREAAKLHTITDGTLPSREALLEDLALIRTRDYAISRGEREDGILSLAVPIFDNNRKALFSLSIAAPSTRLDEEAIQTLVPRMQEISMHISQQLFYM